MAIQRYRALGGTLSAALGAAGVAGLWPTLGIVADPSVCIGLSPAQSWVGMNLHLVSESVACPHGTYAAAESFAPVFGVTFAVSISALLVGLATLILAVGGGLVLRRALRNVRGWLCDRLVPVLLGALSVPQPVPVPVRVDSRRAVLAHHPQQRRGPPRRSC